MSKINKLYLVFAYSLILLFLIFLFVSPDTQTLVFFRQGKDFMADFFNHVYYVKDLNPYEFNIDIASQNAGDKIYTPFTYLLFYYFSKIFSCNDITMNVNVYPKLGLAFVTCFFTICSFVLFYILQKAASFKNKFWILFSLIFSGIFLYSLERGNLILLSVICCSLFLLKDRLNIGENNALIALVCATALKITPGVFSLFYLYKKDYRNFFKFCILSLICFLIPFIFFKGQFNNIYLFFDNLKIHAARYSLSYFFELPFLSSVIEEKCNVLFAIMGFLSACTGFFIVPYVKENFEKISVFVLSFYFLFLNNALYVLLMLFPCFILFMNKINYKKIDYIYLLCFVIIFNPLQIVVHDFCINIILVKLFALIFLLALILQNFINIYRNRKNINNNS